MTAVHFNREDEVRLNRPLIVTIAGALLIVLAVALNFFLRTEEEAVPPESVASPTSIPPPPSAGAGIERVAPAQTPAFDVVRVNPEGDVVMAGRGVPGSSIIIKDLDETIGEVVVDDRGEWVFVPTQPVPPGKHQFGLEMKSGEASPVISDDIVVMIVPEPGTDIAGRAAAAKQEALVVKLPRDKAGTAQLLQQPSPGAAEIPLSIDVIHYDDDGNLTIGGRASPQALLQVYLSNEHLGGTAADDGGRWTLSPSRMIEPGLYTLRVDQIDEHGKVAARSAIPFARSAPLEPMEEGEMIVVQPGNSLWRIARRTYGDGHAYALIYRANRDQIQDPDLIYPGQILAAPSVN